MLADKFAEEIKIAMKQRQISKSEMARRLNVKPSVVSRYLSSGTNLTTSTVEKIVVAMDCDLYWHVELRRKVE